MRNLTLIAVFFFLAAAGAFFIFRSKPETSAALDSFAKCLADKGAIMYGADWCPHCQNEKKAFSGAFKFIPYVECPDDPNRCLAAGISAYPTWIFPASPAGPPSGEAGGPEGKRLVGEQGIEKLAEESGCQLPK